jgi:hypothetical protein
MERSCYTGYEPMDIVTFTECSFEQYRALEEQGYDRSRRWFIVSRGFFELRASE